MSHRIKEETVRNLCLVRVETDSEMSELSQEREQEMIMSRGGGPGEGDQGGKTVRRAEEKIGRNSPCPCGSGKKYKKCCGKAA
jgi:preprotein translocase subunit SecA